MDRRKFLSIASFAGLSVASLDAFGRPARPGARMGRTPLLGAPRSPLFLTINASGGWDPTSLCDPKGAASDIDTDAMNWSFRARDVGTTPAGIRYAPLGAADRPEYFREFFERHDRRLLVINGIDLGTRGHEAGARSMWSGRLEQGLPSFTALVAAVHGRDLPMSYLSFGGHDETMGEVARTRGAGPRSLAFNPDRDEDEVVTFQAQGGRIHASRTGADELQRLQRYLPELDIGPNPLIRQVQVALAAYRAGITVAVDLDLDGFDTHEDHDAGHIPRLVQLLEGLDFLVDEAERQGVGGDYVALVGSELGRAPGYNEANGKDHGGVTSMMAFGAGITGGRVIGATSERHAARPIDPATLQVDDRGTYLAPVHIHRDLRRLAGIDGDPLVQRHALDVADAEDMSLFV